ncbi:hypothetical protein WAQ86_004776 [Salmonella enterica]
MIYVIWHLAAMIAFLGASFFNLSNYLANQNVIGFCNQVIIGFAYVYIVFVSDWDEKIDRLFRRRRNLKRAKIALRLSIESDRNRGVL